MSPIVTRKSSWRAKSYKYILFKKLDYHLRIIGRRGYNLYTLRNVIDRDEGVKIIVRRKWTHEVNPPNVKKFYLKNPTLRHLMPFGNIPRPLASIASHNEGSCIFK